MSTFAGQAAIAGVGMTVFTKGSGRSVLSLAAEACRKAIADAGLEPVEIDGVASFSVLDDSVPSQAVATVLGLPEQTYVLDLALGGQAPSFMVMSAAMAIVTGTAKNVVCFRALNGYSGTRVGSGVFPGPGGQYRYPIGFNAYVQYMAIWARRFMIETGASETDLAAVALAQREYARVNPQAIERRELTLAEYLAAPFVAEPYRIPDCTNEVDGACAVVVSSRERARDLRNPPAVIAAGAYACGHRAGLDIGDSLLWPDLSRNYTSLLPGRLRDQCGRAPRDVDFAQIYDCFTGTVLMGLEGLGIVGRGESGAFVRSGATTPQGSFPTNTNGGLLCEGYLHGMNTIVEAVMQIQGRAGLRQLPRHESCVVTSGGMMDGSALILTTD